MHKNPLSKLLTFLVDADLDILVNLDLFKSNFCLTEELAHVPHQIPKSWDSVWNVNNSALICKAHKPTFYSQ